MKWYATEPEPGAFDFEAADAVLEFADAHGLRVRGHCLFWDKEKWTQAWARSLSDEELRSAMEAWLGLIVPRYRGKLMCWDVLNETLTGGYFAGRLGTHTPEWILRVSTGLDPDTPLFLNEYSIIDNDAKLERYVALIEGLRARGAPVGGIGIQEHAAERFAPGADVKDTHVERQSGAELDPRDVWRRLDRLAELDLPIHLTEISVKTPDPVRRADALEAAMRTAFAHPAVDAIVLWGFWEKAHWLGSDAALVEADWGLLPAGERLHHLLTEEWTTRIETVSDDDGLVRFRGFYGEYEIRSEDGARARRVRFPAP